MRNKYSLVGVVVLIAFYAFILMVIFSSNIKAGGKSVPTLVEVIPSNTSPKVGDKFTVDVKISPTETISGAQFDMAYNSDIVSVDSVVEGGLFKNGQQSFFLPGTITKGLVTGVAGTTIGAGSQTTTPGVFATLNCTALKTGNSMFVISKLMVANKDAVVVPLASPIITQVQVASAASLWDLNLDGKVDLLDMAILAAAFGTANAQADFNKDGVVDVLDLIIMAQNYTG